MFIGNGGVGKTTLATGLLELTTTDIQKTDGIEVHIGRCYIDKTTGKWYPTIEVEGKCNSGDNALVVIVALLWSLDINVSTTALWLKR